MLLYQGLVVIHGIISFVEVSEMRADANCHGHKQN